jgi:RNA 3'-terminal phosphate cyclase
MEQAVKQKLKVIDSNIVPTFIHSPPHPSGNGGLGILLYAETSYGHSISASTMLEVPSTSREETLVHQAKLKGARVVGKLEKQLTHGGLVDGFLADQIVIFMALATSGFEPSYRSKMDITEERRRCEVLVGKVSLHTLTAMKIAETMLGNIAFSTEKRGGIGMVLVCEKTVTSSVDAKQI